MSGRGRGRVSTDLEAERERCMPDDGEVTAGVDSVPGDRRQGDDGRVRRKGIT